MTTEMQEQWTIVMGDLQDGLLITEGKSQGWANIMNLGLQKNCVSLKKDFGQY